MKAILIAALMLLASTQALAVLALWTGQSRYVTTVSGMPGMSCQYQAAGGTFWKTYKGMMCPPSIDVE